MKDRKVQTGFMLPKDVIEMVRFIAYHKRVSKSAAVEQSIVAMHQLCLAEASNAINQAKQ
jgi:hypothetical protein